MNTNHNKRLSGQLAEIESRIKKVRFRRASGYTALVLLVALTVGSLFDYLAALSMPERLFLTAVCYAAVAAYAWFAWWRPFLKPMDLEDVAWMLEAAVPQLNEKLISSVEFSSLEDGRLSVDLINRVLEETEVDLLGISPIRAFPFKTRHVVVPGILVLAFVTFLAVPRFKFRRLVKRVAFPSYHDATVGRFGLDVIHPRPGKKAEGESIRFVVQCTDPNVRYAELCVEDHRVRRFVMRFDERAKLFGCTVTDVRRSFTYWACSETVNSAKHVMQIAKRPKIEKVGIVYRFPAYTGLQISKVESTAGDLKAYPGTKADLVIKATKPLQHMRMIWQGARKEVPLNEARLEGRITLDIRESGLYSLHLLDMEDLTSIEEAVYSVVVLEDKAPSVKLDRPDGDVYLDPADTMDLAWSATDDFGVKRQELLCTDAAGRESVVGLEADLRAYALVFKETDFKRGDEIECRIRAYDGAGQYTDSPARNVSLTYGRELQLLGPFLRTAGNLRDRTEAIRARVRSVSGTAEKMQFARDYPGGAGTADLDHNLNLMREQQRWLSVQIAAAEHESAALDKQCFFPESRLYNDLMGRYFRQERLFTVTGLVNENTGSAAIASLETMAELIRNMIDALIRKAERQVSLRRARCMSEAAKTLEDPCAVYDDAFRACMAGMLAEAEMSAADSAELDKLAAMITGQLRSIGENLSSCALELELYDRDHDWVTVRQVAGDYAALADVSREPATQKASRLAAAALNVAAERRSTAQLKRIASALPDIEEYTRLRELSRRSATNLITEAGDSLIEIPAENYRIACHALADIAETDKERLTTIHKRLETVSSEIKDLKSEEIEQIRSAEKNIFALITSLADVAKEMQKVARLDLSAQDGSISAAKSRIALSADLNGIVARQMTAAVMLLRRLGDRPSADTKWDHEERVGQLGRVYAGLSDAAARLVATTDLVARLEAGERNELAESEKKMLAQQLRQRVDETLDPQMKRTLGMLMRLRGLQHGVAGLAEEAGRMEREADKSKAEELLSSTDRLRKDLKDLLDGPGDGPSAEPEAVPVSPGPDAAGVKEMRSALEQMKNELVEIESAKAAGAGIHAKIHVHELETIRILDAVPGNLFNTMEEERIAETRSMLLACTFEQKAWYLDEIAGMVARKDAGSATRMRDIAALLRADQAKASERDLFEQQVQSKSGQVIGRAAGIKLAPALKGNKPLVDAAVAKMDTFEANIRAGSFSRARANLEALDRDIADTDSSRGRPTRVPSRGPQRTETGLAQQHSESHRKILEAVSELDAARSALASGETGSEGTQSFNSAAQALRQAEEMLTESALARVTELVSVRGSAQNYMSGKGGGAAGGNGEDGGVGVEYSDIPDVALGESWQGAGTALTSESRGGQKIMYDDYYRRATMRYLKEVQKESRQ